MRHLLSTLRRLASPTGPARRLRPNPTARLGLEVLEGRALPSGTLEPERLALLADALEDAGCDSAEVLGHLRGPGPHVRGCWALDLCLGRD